MQKKILLVEDEGPIRRLMTLGLNQHGYHTESCENGVNALKKMETYLNNNIPLDGVVVDLRLPDIDGIKLVKIMRYRYPDIPIILITGYTDRYSQEEIHNLQVNAFMEKPFTPEELSQQLTKVLEARKPSEKAGKGKKEEAIGASAYIILKVDEEMGFFDTYKELYAMDNVVYCDAVKGEYDIILLAKADNSEKIREIAETKIKKVKGVKTMDILEVGHPILDESTRIILQEAEEVLDGNFDITSRQQVLNEKVCAYILIDVEKEKLDGIYPTLRLDDNVVYCDYTTGKFNLVLFMAANHFDEIDRFITEKIIDMDGVLKVKEFPIVSLYEM